MKPANKKTFKDWTKDELHYVFGLTLSTNPLASLTEWVQTDMPLVADEVSYLESIRALAEIYIDTWNEQELRDNFISLVTRLVNFNAPESYFASFSGRKMSVKLQDVALKGVVDWMVATGMGQPQKPFFFIHEYKPEANQSSDARGQLLSTMLAANVLNKGDDPDSVERMYGCYINGRMWFFCVLEGRRYSFSRQYSATDLSDLQWIVKILKARKQAILQALSPQMAYSAQLAHA